MLVLKNAELINGKAKEPIKNQKVLVDRNWITDIGEDKRYPESSHVMDLLGYTILPG